MDVDDENDDGYGCAGFRFQDTSRHGLEAIKEVRG